MKTTTETKNVQKQPEAGNIKKPSKKRTFQQMRARHEDPETERVSRKMELRGDHYSAGTPSECKSETDSRGLTSEFERMEIEIYGKPKEVKKQESLDDLKEMIEHVIKEPLKSMANSIDRAIKLVAEIKLENKRAKLTTQD